MKLMKYLLAALVIVSVTKKIHVIDNADKVMTTSSLKLENYNPTSRTAHMINSKNQLITFVGVVETNPTFTPPSLSNPALHFLTTIATPTSIFSEKHFRFGSSNNTKSLYAIQVSGSPTAVKSRQQTIGYYWPDNEIVQLNNGETYVSIIKQAQGNYRKINTHAIGPVWTWFNSDELLRTYGISTKANNFKDLVSNVGTIRNHDEHRTWTLYGVRLDPFSVVEQPNLHSKDFIQSYAPKHILKEHIIPGLDEHTRQMRLYLAQQMQGAYQILQNPRLTTESRMPLK